MILYRVFTRLDAGIDSSTIKTPNWISGEEQTNDIIFVSQLCFDHLMDIQPCNINCICICVLVPTRLLQTLSGSNDLIELKICAGTGKSNESL